MRNESWKKGNGDREDKGKGEREGEGAKDSVRKERGKKGGNRIKGAMKMGEVKEEYEGGGRGRCRT